MPEWLTNRLFEHRDLPKPRFAFQGTINWMRALALLVNEDNFTDELLNDHYARVQRRATNETADTIVFETILMSFHNLAALHSLNSDIVHHYDTCRAAIISWYYSIYFSSRAMIAGCSGASPENHGSASRVFQTDIVDNGLLLSPFSLRITSLVSADSEATIATYRNGNEYDLNTYAQNEEEAWGGVVSYLNGTADYERWRAEEKLRSSREFRALGVENFRTRRARELRDLTFERGYVNFLVQAFRYRGKANYRDSIFLSYGADRTELIDEFIPNLFTVAKAFLRMASFYLSRRTERGTWTQFTNDLNTYSRLSLPTDVLRI